MIRRKSCSISTKSDRNFPRSDFCKPALFEPVFCIMRQKKNFTRVIIFVLGAFFSSILASFSDSRFIFMVSSERFFVGSFSQTIFSMSFPVNTFISEIPHQERLCFISSAADFAPAPRHCVIMTARFANISGAGRCGIHK